MTPPGIGPNSFSSTNVTAVYVPSSSVEAYKTAPDWSDLYYSVIFADTTTPSTTFGITLNIGASGIIQENNITLSDGSVVYLAENTTTIFTITALDGYEVATLNYNGTDVKSQMTNNQYSTPELIAHATLSVTFKKTLYRVALKDASTGTINLLCEYGATPSFDFTAATDWQVNAVYYNSVDVTDALVDGVFTVPPITGNALLNVSFVSIITGAPELINNRVKVYSTDHEIIVEGSAEGETISLYSLSGKHIRSFVSKGEKINIRLDSNAVYLLKTGAKTFKVIL